MAPFVVTAGILLLCLIGASAAATIERYRERRRYDPRHGSYVGVVKMPGTLADAVTETIPISRSLVVRPYVPTIVVDPVHVGATVEWSPLDTLDETVVGYDRPLDTPEQRLRDTQHGEALEEYGFVLAFRAIDARLGRRLERNEALWEVDATIQRWINEGLADAQPSAAALLHPVRVWVAEETATGEFPLPRRLVDAR